MKIHYLLFMLLVSSNLYSQTLFGIDIEHSRGIGKVGWETEQIYDDYLVDVIKPYLDFDYVKYVLNDNEIVFSKKNPSIGMYDSVYSYLFNILGSPKRRDEDTSIRIDTWASTKNYDDFKVTSYIVLKSHDRRLWIKCSQQIEQF